MRALPGLDRCERPTSALASTSTVQPGRLAQGPDEKFGLAGFTAGAVWGVSAISSDPPRSMRLALGRDVLRLQIRLPPTLRKRNLCTNGCESGRMKSVSGHCPASESLRFKAVTCFPF